MKNGGGGERNIRRVFPPVDFRRAPELAAAAVPEAAPVAGRFTSVLRPRCCEGAIESGCVYVLEVTGARVGGCARTRGWGLF